MFYSLDVNIGLQNNTNGDIILKSRIDFIYSYLKQYGFNIRVSGVGTDSRTLVARNESLLFNELVDIKTKLYNYCEFIQQDCIAVYTHNNSHGYGQLIGPNADKWGEFNLDYFVPYQSTIEAFEHTNNALLYYVKSFEHDTPTNCNWFSCIINCNQSIKY